MFTAIDVAKNRGHDEIVRLLPQWDDGSGWRNAVLLQMIRFAENVAM